MVTYVIYATEHDYTTYMFDTELDYYNIHSDMNDVKITVRFARLSSFYNFDVKWSVIDASVTVHSGEKFVIKSLAKILQYTKASFKEYANNTEHTMFLIKSLDAYYHWYNFSQTDTLLINSSDIAGYMYTSEY